MSGYGGLLTLMNGRPLGEVLAVHPAAADFLANLRLEGLDASLPLPLALEAVPDELLEEFGTDRGELPARLCDFLEAVAPAPERLEGVSSLTVLGGHDKSGSPERVSLTISAGQVVSIVGPTGAGKSRLLADIECLAQGDTPTGRRVLVNGAPVTEERRFAMEGRLVAQLSQNMNFVMDLSVRDFLRMHARSRLATDPEGIAGLCWEKANALAGEGFDFGTKLTQLSGGQSRALMIADTAYMSASPVVLIDEIENAGVDRLAAISLLARREKIVLVSTHDPLLALSAQRRIIIRNGGVAAVLDTSEEERCSLEAVARMDAVQARLRQSLRGGARITEDMTRLPPQP